MPFFCNNKNPAIHYLIRGQGEPLLLIHGLGGSGADWAFQVAALERRFLVIVPDLPGSGRQSTPRGEYTIEGFSSGAVVFAGSPSEYRGPTSLVSPWAAPSLWKWRPRRPSHVPRLGLINSLATYRPDDWHKWLEVHVSEMLVRLLGMRRAAWLLALRLFPEPWQQALRRHAAAAVGAVPASSYLGMGLALARWAIIDRLGRLRSRVLLIAAEHDFTPLAEKRELAARLKADIVVVRGSRHGTPFDSVEATNASLLALLTDQPLPPRTRWVRDTPARAQALSLRGSIAEDRASGA